MKIIIVILIYIIITSIYATKMTISNRSLVERSEILKLRFNNKISDNLLNLKINLNRDCYSLAYSNNDSDLTVKSILKSYPKKMVVNFLETSLLGICPWGLLRAHDYIKKVYVKIENDVENYLKKYPLTYKDMDVAYDLYLQLSCRSELKLIGERMILLYKKEVKGGDFPQKIRNHYKKICKNMFLN